MDANGNVLKSEVRGGEIVMGEDGTPNGYLKEQAGTYTRSFLDNDNLFSVNLSREIMADIEHHLLSEGYMMYIDSWGNYFYNNSYYQAAQELDKAGNMHFVLGTTYEIESWMNVDDALAKAVDIQNAKYYCVTSTNPLISE